MPKWVGSTTRRSGGERASGGHTRIVAMTAHARTVTASVLGGWMEGDLSEADKPPCIAMFEHGGKAVGASGFPSPSCLRAASVSRSARTKRTKSAHVDRERLLNGAMVTRPFFTGRGSFVRLSEALAASGRP